MSTWTSRATIPPTAVRTASWFRLVGDCGKKSWLKNGDFKESLTYAIEDFKNNYETYISQQR